MIHFALPPARHSARHSNVTTLVSPSLRAAGLQEAGPRLPLVGGLVGAPGSCLPLGEENVPLQPASSYTPALTFLTVVAPEDGALTPPRTGSPFGSLVTTSLKSTQSVTWLECPPCSLHHQPWPAPPLSAITPRAL